MSEQSETSWFSEAEFLTHGVIFDAHFDASVGLVEFRGHPVVKLAYGRSIFWLAEHVQGTDASDVGTSPRPFGARLQYAGERALRGTGEPEQPEVTLLNLPMTMFATLSIEYCMRGARVRAPWRFRLQDAQWRLKKAVDAALSLDASLLEDWIRLRRTTIPARRLLEYMSFGGYMGTDVPSEWGREIMFERVRAAIDYLSDDGHST